MLSFLGIELDSVGMVMPKNQQTITFTPMLQGLLVVEPCGLEHGFNCNGQRCSNTN